MKNVTVGQNSHVTSVDRQLSKSTKSTKENIRKLKFFLEKGDNSSKKYISKRD